MLIRLSDLVEAHPPLYIHRYISILASSEISQLYRTLFHRAAGLSRTAIAPQSQPKRRGRHGATSSRIGDTV